MAYRRTIRDEIERVQRIYQSEWRKIELKLPNVTRTLTWRERLKILFTGRESYRAEFSVQVKGDAYIMMNPEARFIHIK